MTLESLEKDINEMIPTLFAMAREATWNKISENHKFILSEIKDGKIIDEQRKIDIKANDKKTPKTLTELMPELRELYTNIYDINLHIYKATKNLIIIDFRYYPRTSLDREYRIKVLNYPTMLHCKIFIPQFVSDKKEKFDINWEHKSLTNRFKRLMQKLHF